MHGSKNLTFVDTPFCSRESFRVLGASKIDDLELCSTNSCITLIQGFELYYKDGSTFSVVAE
jgi:hypothetical protein